MALKRVVLNVNKTITLKFKRLFWTLQLFWYFYVTLFLCFLTWWIWSAFNYKVTPSYLTQFRIAHTCHMASCIALFYRLVETIMIISHLITKSKPLLFQNVFIVLSFLLSDHLHFRILSSLGLIRRQVKVDVIEFEVTI